MLTRFRRSGARREDGVPSPTFRRLGFNARVFIALVGISSVASLIIGLVLYYFAQDRLMAAENNLLIQRSRTANDGAGAFLEGLRNPEDQTLPEPGEYADELVQVVSDPTGLGVVYLGPEGEPLAARDGLGDSINPQETLQRLDVSEAVIEEVRDSTSGQGRLVRASGTYITVWPLTAGDGSQLGVIVYDAPQDELEQTLSYLQFGVIGAILASVVLGSVASFVMARQITRPLADTRDAAIRIASGDYTTRLPVASRDELGELARAVNYMAGEIKRYVDEIQDQKRRLEAVLAATPEALITTDAAERVTMCNPAAKMLGIDQESVGKSLEELGVHEQVVRCVRHAGTEGFAVAEISSDDSEKAYLVYASRTEIESSVTVDGAQHATEVILAVRDISEHRSMERSKTAFFSDVSHELRTPLTTIQSAVGLLERAGERLDPLEHRALELAEGELARIRGMVEELLVLAQMDSWQYSLRLEPTGLTRIVGNAVEAVETKARRFGIEINVFEEPVSPINCDAEKLYQVFLNLLDNAIKYSEPGARVDVTITETQSGRSAVVRIADTGLGIPKEDLPHLFERFYRVDKNRSRATGGSGLGLAISKQIVEMHEGSISVESEPGRGSIFTVILPKNPSGGYAN